MQALSSSTTTALRVVTSLLQSVALFLTIFRLWYRISIRMFWWEDAWALLAFVCAIATLITEWLHMQTDGSASLVSAWVYSLGFLAVSWTVRISVMFSIVRIVSPSQVYRRITLAAAALLLLMWILDTAQKIWNCQSSDIWYIGAGPAGKPWCRMSRAMTIFELCMVFIADALLVALPVRLLWNVKLPKGERRMILLIFSSSIVMALASFFHGTCQLVPLVPLITPAVDFEIAFSLIVCNQLVVVTYVYRVLRKEFADQATSELEVVNSLSRRTRSQGRSTTGARLSTNELNACSMNEIQSQNTWRMQLIDEPTSYADQFYSTSDDTPSKSQC